MRVPFLSAMPTSHALRKAVKHFQQPPHWLGSLIDFELCPRKKPHPMRSAAHKSSSLANWRSVSPSNDDANQSVRGVRRWLLHPLGTQAKITLAETPCRCGRKVALLSASKTKVPPGLIAKLFRMRSLSSHAIVHACRHSPSTKRIIVPLKPTGPAAPGGPGGPGDPGGPWSPFSPRATSFSPQPDTNTDSSMAAMNHLTCIVCAPRIVSWGQKKGPDAKTRRAKVPFRSAEDASAPNAIPRLEFGSHAGSDYF